MNLNQRSIKELKRILEKDYKIILNDEDVAKLGLSLLKISRLALACTEKNNLSVQAKERHSFDNTTKDKFF